MTTIIPPINQVLMISFYNEHLHRFSYYTATENSGKQATEDLVVGWCQNPSGFIRVGWPSGLMFLISLQITVLTLRFVFDE